MACCTPQGSTDAHTTEVNRVLEWAFPRPILDAGAYTCIVMAASAFAALHPRVPL